MFDFLSDDFFSDRDGEGQQLLVGSADQVVSFGVELGEKVLKDVSKFVRLLGEVFSSFFKSLFSFLRFFSSSSALANRLMSSSRLR